MMDVGWLTLGLLVAGLFLLYSWLTRNNDYWAKRGIAYVEPVLFFGNMAGVLFRRVSFTDNVTAMYRQLKKHKIGGVFEFGNPTLYLTDPELIRQVTVKHFDHFSDRRVISGRQTDPLFERSLPSLKGAEWRAMRNRLSPAFTTSKLKAMYPLVNQCGRKFAEYLAKRPDAKTSPIEFKAAFTRLTNDVIASVAFGHESNAISDPEEKFYKYAQGMTTFRGIRMLIMFGYLLFPKLMVFLRISFLPKGVTEYFEHLIDGAMEHRLKTGLTRPDMLQLLMAAQRGGIERAQGDEHDVGTIGEDEQAAAAHSQHLTSQAGDQSLITNEDIAAQAFIFFFAGFETVATMLSFLAHELAVNPDIQERLYSEVKDTMEQSGGQFTYEAVQAMKYLDMVVQESLRKYPPAVATDRTCTKAFTVPDMGMVIEEGAVVMVPIYPLHHDPEYFPEPEKFDPERFSEENRNNIKPYTYLPFGSGPHNCIGMRLALLEVKVAVCHMLAACELRVCAKTEIPLQLSKTTFQMTTDNGFWLCAVPRSA